MELPPIQFSEDPSHEIEAFLGERIHEFNSAATGHFDGEGYAAVIRDADDHIIAGVSGHTWGGCCHIARLWVHETARRKGFGAGLLQAVESHASARGCTLILLSSHDFQAPGFYRRAGYMELTRIEGHPQGHSDILFVKQLRIGNQES